MNSLDYLPAITALLDQNGVILEVNQAWREFALENGLKDRNSAVGTSYLSVCTFDSTDPYAVMAYSSIVRVLSGIVEEDSFTYPCHAPHQERWFCCKIKKWRDEGFVVMHFRSQNALVARDLSPFDSDAELAAHLQKHEQIWRDHIQ